MKSPRFNSTIKEILDFCAIPNDITDRKELLLDAADQFPGFEKFISFAFTAPSDALVVMENFPKQKPISKIAGKHELLFSDFLMKELPKHRELKNVSIMRSKLIQEMDFLDPTDFEYIVSALRGQFIYPNKKISEVALSMAFPHIFPN